MKIRNRFLMFLFMGWFQGLYLFYWQCSVQNGIKHLKGKRMGGGLTLFLSIITLGVYALVWQCKTCKFLLERGCGNLKIITLILSLLIIGIIINPLLIQGQINKFMEQEIGC